MVKEVNVFLLFLKTNENNFYLFLKNCSLFYFVFKNYLKDCRQNSIRKFSKIFNSFAILNFEKKMQLGV